MRYFVGKAEKEKKKLKISTVSSSEWFSNFSLYKNHPDSYNLLTLFILDLTLSLRFEKYLAGAEKVLVVKLPQHALKCQIKTQLDLP